MSLYSYFFLCISFFLIDVTIDKLSQEEFVRPTVLGDTVSCGRKACRISHLQAESRERDSGVIAPFLLFIQSICDDTLRVRVVFSPQLKLSVNTLINTSRDTFAHDFTSSQADNKNNYHTLGSLLKQVGVFGHLLDFLSLLRV